MRHGSIAGEVAVQFFPTDPPQFLSGAVELEQIDLIKDSLSDARLHRSPDCRADPGKASCGHGQTISASEFRLLDEAGKVRARLFLDGPYEPKLTLYDWRGGEDEQVSLAATSIGGQLTLSYSRNREYLPAQQQGQVQLSAEENGRSLKIGRKGPVGQPGVLTWDTYPGVHLSASKLVTCGGTVR